MVLVLCKRVNAFVEVWYQAGGCSLVGPPESPGSSPWWDVRTPEGRGNSAGSVCWRLLS